MNAIILSSGLGDRLRPITDFIPKPLLPIIDRPIIEIIIQQLNDLGIKKIGTNLFHKAAMINNFLERVKFPGQIVLEKELSGSGGALCCFSSLTKQDFMIHNCDVLSNINLSRALEFHMTHRPMATIVLTKNRGTNFFKVDEEQRIRAFEKKDTSDDWTYTGIAIFSKEITDYFPKKQFFGIAEILRRLLNDKVPIFGIPTKEAWYDIGFHESYWRCHQEILKQETKIRGIEVAAPIFVHPSSQVHTKDLKGFVCVGQNCLISRKVRLKDTIVFPGTHLEHGAFKNCLVANQFCIKVK